MFSKKKKFFQVEDLSLLFIHIHHLLNEFRPHQARETLRVMMEVQRRQRIETANRFQKHLEKVRSNILHKFLINFFSTYYYPLLF